MGLGDTLKGLTKQAQDTVAEHRDQIHGAVERVSATADQKTGGKYRDTIATLHRKATETVDRLSGPPDHSRDQREPPSGR